MSDHIVIFPFMAKGHTIPLLHLAAALSSSSSLNLRVSLITTPANAPFFRQSLPLSDHPNIRLLLLPFPVISPPLLAGVESTDTLPSPSLYPAFLSATALLRKPFDRLLLRLCLSPSVVPPPLCVISDFFLGWTLPACERLGVPRIVFHGMGVFSMAVCKSLWVHRPYEKAAPGASFSVPGIPDRLRFTEAEVPETVRAAGDPDDPVVQFIGETGAADVNSWGILVNSFDHLEMDFVAAFESFYLKNARAWLVGPLSLLSPPPPPPSPENDDACLQWLEGKQPGSVVYVSFGTQTHVADEQLDEVAHGLAAAGWDFLWAVRSSEKWAPPAEEGRTMGRIERGWVPQREVLGHPAVGGFVSHCGWNSVLESVAAGVPMLAWPMMAEQTLNAKLLVEEMGMAIALKGFGREEVCEGVKELMGGEKGRRARAKAVGLQSAAKKAVGEAGGSSAGRLEEMIQELRRTQAEAVEENGGVNSGLSQGLELDGEGVVVEESITMEEWKDGGSMLHEIEMSRSN